MTSTDEALWNAIRNFEIDDPESALTFTDRLARENGWTLEYAIRAVEEYKRFMFLVCTTGQTMTPSDEVDQVWHLHLLYTQSYWEDFCRDTLKRNVHHGPTRGGKAETEKYTDLYEQTKTHYENCFGAPPPPDLWPDSETRFREVHFRRVNLHRNWIISKPKLLI
ncbi:MAG: hypothetical protein FD123_2950 [Bacteroidetes bacterium]|nr:MAG: hypothetical protein FD123_2950 [Bacteroidota bacterium]